MWISGTELTIANVSFHLRRFTDVYVNLFFLLFRQWIHRRTRVGQLPSGVCFFRQCNRRRTRGKFLFLLVLASFFLRVNVIFLLLYSYVLIYSLIFSYCVLYPDVWRTKFGSFLTLFTPFPVAVHTFHANWIKYLFPCTFTHDIFLLWALWALPEAAMHDPYPISKKERRYSLFLCLYRRYWCTDKDKRVWLIRSSHDDAYVHFFVFSCTKLLRVAKYLGSLIIVIEQNSRCCCV